MFHFNFDKIKPENFSNQIMGGLSDSKVFN